MLVVTNSMVKHNLGASAYPERVAQCKEAVRVISKKYPEVTALRDVTLEMLCEFTDEFSPVVFKRALHVVSEDRRTLATVSKPSILFNFLLLTILFQVDALSKKDFISVGAHMTASHESLRDNYEVSCKELDILVELAIKHPGVYGSRMTGGGFGGCTVTLVKKSMSQALIESLERNYKLSTNHQCECYVAEPSEGAGEINLDPFLAKSTKSWMSLVIPVAVCVLAVGVIGVSWHFYSSPKPSAKSH